VPDFVLRLITPPDHNLESELLHLDAISSREQVRDVVTAGLIRNGFIADARAGIDYNDFCVRDDRFTRVGDAASKRRVRGLRAKWGDTG
jgi:hypothetical protein